MAEMRASPVVNPRLKRIAEVLADLQGPMGQIIPFTDVNPFKVLMPKASTFENLAYGNSPLVMPTGVTNRRLPIVKTGREGELTDIADVALMASGLPMASRGVARGANYLGDVLTQAVTRNPQATSMRALDEIARMSPVPQIAPKPPQMPMTPPKSDIGFYSQLEAATIPLQNKGTGDQYLAQLQKSAGVKPEEIQWTGLNEFLTGKPSVTKQEIQDYLRANRVDVQEVVRQDYTPSRAEILEFMKTERGKGLKYDEAENELYLDKLGTNSRFPEYQLRGGRNYREILLTLPQPPEAKIFRDLEMRINSGERLKPEELQQYRDLAESKAFKGQFFGEHFANPNVLAHMRVNDRIVGGKKTLFIEEIQSDWHQTGRKQGYQEDYDPRKKGVPDAPFKTSWHELTLKRAIQEASEKGYDQIAFTTGRTQAKRYDLEDASGMKGFYDNILPKSLEKLGKKFDAKVGKTKVGGVEVWQMDITPKMRESVTTKGQPLFAIPTVGATALGASMYDQDPLEQFLNYQ